MAGKTASLLAFMKPEQRGLHLGQQDEYNSAFVLLVEHVSAANTDERLGAIMGLGLAYAGTRRQEVRRFEDVASLLAATAHDWSLLIFVLPETDRNW